MIRNIFWILITLILAPFLYIDIFLKRLSDKDGLRILIIDIGKIGDLVCTTPVFREIKKKFPNSYLGVAINEHSYGVVQNNSHIDEFIFLDSERYQGFWGQIKLIRAINKKKFNWSLNLTPYAHNTILAFWAMIPNRITSTARMTGKAAKLFSFLNDYRLEYKQHTLKLRHNLELLRFLGINDFSEEKEIFITEKEEKNVDIFLEENNLKKNDFIIGISVTAGNKFREWEPIKFSQLADRLIKELGANIILFGAPADEKIIQEVMINMKNKPISSTNFKVNELAAIFKKLRIFISVDTGPLYIAHSVGTPVVDIVGPVDTEVQPPRDNISELVYKKIYCWPCVFIYPGARSCKEGHLRCVKEISADDVFSVVKKLIKRIYGQ
jgi:heptosyltransferase-2